MDYTIDVIQTNTRKDKLVLTNKINNVLEVVFAFGMKDE